MPPGVTKESCFTDMLVQPWKLCPLFSSHAMTLNKIKTSLEWPFAYLWSLSWVQQPGLAAEQTKTHVLRVAIAIRKWLRVPESHSKLSALIQFQETLAGSYIIPENGQQKTL